MGTKIRPIEVKPKLWRSEGARLREGGGWVGVHRLSAGADIFNYASVSEAWR